jgi:hypothetical protein
MPDILSLILEREGCSEETGAGKPCENLPCLADEYYLYVPLMPEGIFEEDECINLDSIDEH